MQIYVVVLNYANFDKKLHLFLTFFCGKCANILQIENASA